MGTGIGRWALASALLASLGGAEGRGGPIVVLGDNLQGPDASLSAVASVGTASSKAVGFTMSSRPLVLDTVTLRLREQAGSSSTLTVALYGGNGGPSGHSLVTFSTPAIPTVASNVAFTSSSGFVLQANTTYWLEVSGTSDTLNGIVWYAGAVGSTPAGVASYAGGRVASPFAVSDAMTASSVVNTFQITAFDATAVPEPPGLIQAGVALASGLACFARRRWR